MTLKGRGQVVNRGQLADIFGIALNTVDSWVKQGAPYLKKGAGKGQSWEFNTSDVSAWLRAKAAEDATGKADVNEDSLRKRRLTADTLRAELELSKAQSVVAPLDQMEHNLAKLFAEIRTNLRNIPDTMTPVLIGMTDESKFKAVLLKEIDRILEALANADLTAELEEDEEE